MGTFVFAAASAGIGLGFLLLTQGLRGREILPDRAPSIRSLGNGSNLARVAGAAAAALVVLAITSWPVAAAAAFVLAVSGPRIVGGRQERADSIARTQAVATWTEMIRDNMAGAAGLEQALIATGPVVPDAIAPEVRRFVHRIDDMPLGQALTRLGDDLNHPSADLVVAALTNAVRMESRQLGPLLTRLADSIRGDVRMRLRVEVGRARIRTSARIVMGVTAFTVAFLYIFSRELLDVYDTPIGQVWLLVVLGIFAVGGWLMNHYSQIEMPERFSARHRTPSATGAGLS